MSRKTILYVLQQAGSRPLTPDVISNYVNRLLPHPVTPEYVRVELSVLEGLGYVQRRASALDPNELSWLVTDAGREVSTL